MPLPESVERERLHSRRIHCDGYRRSDGLWDLEARLVDEKSFSFANKDRGGTIEAGEALHDLALRLTLDDQFVIQEVVAVSDFTPYRTCPQATGAMERLVGLRISPGWMVEVRSRVGRVEGCTHLIELLGPLATTAFQTMYWTLQKEKEERHHDKGESRQDSRPKTLNSCYALASDGPIVKREWPDFYTGKDK